MSRNQPTQSGQPGPQSPNSKPLSEYTLEELKDAITDDISGDFENDDAFREAYNRIFGEQAAEKDHKNLLKAHLKQIEHTPPSHLTLTKDINRDRNIDRGFEL